jgi:hypothetical protein
MFTCDTFYQNPINLIDNGGRLPMAAVQADAGVYSCATESGKSIDVYEIKDGAGRDDAFMGYWCPYEADQTRFTTLTGLAQYMFTATMDGCSFGIGHKSKDGTVVVGHSNAQRDQTQTSIKQMSNTQKLELRSTLGHNTKLFEPKDYRYRGIINKKRDVSAATFGVFDGTEWKFYAHRYRKTYMEMGVHYIFYGTKSLG